MTAPLPPLPAPADQLNDFFAPDQMHDYAKLAVREALLGIIRKSISHNWIEPSSDGNIVTIPESVLRAMIEELDK